MKNIMLLASLLCVTLIVDAKSLLVQCQTRSHQNDDRLEKHELEEQLFSPSCKTILIEVQDPITAIKLIRYAQPLHEQGKTLLCKAPESIRALISWCPFIDQVFSDNYTCTYDLCISLEELAQLMQKRTNTALDSAYIIIDETIRTLWQEALITDGSFKVGVCCAPMLHETYKEKNPINIQSFFPLGCMQHTSLYSFDNMDEIEIPDAINVYHFDEKQRQSLSDMAAIIHHMDLIITTQPIMIYIAGALGKNIWLIAPEAMLVSEMVTAYPQLRVFTRTAGNEVIFDIMHDLAYTIKKPASQIVTSEIATGELVDKMTILQIKTERITDQKKLDNIYKELHSLQRTFDEFVTVAPELKQLIQELKAANEALWTTEDLIRDKEREKSFDSEFILLARSVYIQNDERCRVKREINELLGSRIVEEKSYKPYN